MTSYQSSITATFTSQVIQGIVACEADEVISYLVFNATIQNGGVSWSIMHGRRNDVGVLPLMSIVEHQNVSYMYVCLVINYTHLKRSMAVHGAAFCWNNETHNKQPGPHLCDLSPYPSDNTLAYTFGSITEWMNAVSLKEYFSPCGKHVVQGTYDAGTAPSVSLFADPFTYELGVVEVHVGLSQNAECGCGSPTLFSGVKLNSWDVNTMI
jgi:hypothetical protein